jgi:flagellar hook-associated protein 3 FlgL
MRVATKTMYDLVKYNLSNITEKLNDASHVVSSGKRINKLSDDPVGLVQSLEIKSVLANIDQIDRNISMGDSWLVAAEGALRHTQDLISDAKVLCIEMASASKTPQDRVSAVSIVQNELEEIVVLANTQISGRYIFSGTDTDTKPFEQDGTYNGNDTPFAINTGNNSLVRIGHDGEAIFGDFFGTLNDLMTALQTDDLAGINTSMDRLDTHFEDLSADITDVGSKMNRMEIKKNILGTLTISNTERLSQIEDADIVEAAMNLSSVEFAYQAALASSSSLMELSLVDYLR